MEHQTAMELPRRCWGCGASVEHERVTLTFPCMLDTWVDGKSFRRGQFFQFCRPCGIKLYQLAFKYLPDGKGH